MASSTFVPRDMKALRFHRRGEISLDSVKTLPCAADEVRVTVAYCGICGTDIHEFLGGPIFPPKEGEKNPYTGVSLPVILGHEISGTITEVGSGVKDLKVDQKVTINPALNDKHFGYELCTMCKVGKYNSCPATANYGLSASGGGFSEEIVVKAASCITLPEGVSLKVAALAEPLAVAHHAISVSGFKPGQSALVCGAGPIGLAIAVILRVLGASTIVVTEVEASRMAQAAKFGADLVLNPLEEAADGSKSNTDSVAKAIREKTGGGVDIAYDATGLQSTLDLSFAGTKPGGIIFNVAIHERPLSMNLNDLSKTEKVLMAAIGYLNEDFEAVLSMLARGAINAEEMVTAVVPLSKAVDGGFGELINNKASHVKILIRPD